MNKRLAGVAIFLSATLFSSYSAIASSKHASNRAHFTQRHEAMAPVKEKSRLIGHRFDVSDLHAAEATTADMFVGMSFSKRGYTVFTAGPKQDTTSMLWLTKPVNTRRNGDETITTYEIIDAIDAHARPGEYLVACQDNRGNDHYAAYANLSNVLLARDKNGKEIAFDEQINPRVVWSVQGAKLVPVREFLHSVRCVNDGSQ